jgi:hypothetical protein
VAFNFRFLTNKKQKVFENDRITKIYAERAEDYGASYSSCFMQHQHQR